MCQKIRYDKWFFFFFGEELNQASSTRKKTGIATSRLRFTVFFKTRCGVDTKSSQEYNTIHLDKKYVE